MNIEGPLEAFHTYRQAVLPAHASKVQIEECRRAFVAGAYYLLMGALMNIGDANVTEEEGIATLEAIQAECEAFAKAVQMEPPDPEPEPEACVTPDSNYTVPDPLDVRSTLRRMGEELSQACPPGFGFNLLLFEFGERGSLFYIANAERADVINIMREFIQRSTQ